MLLTIWSKDILTYNKYYVCNNNYNYDMHARTHAHTQPFNSFLSGTTRVGRYQKKHSHPSWSSDILYHLPPFTTIHHILFVQFTSLTVLSDNLSPGPLWSSSWPWTLNFINGWCNYNTFQSQAWVDIDCEQNFNMKSVIENGVSWSLLNGVTSQQWWPTGCTYQLC